MFRSAFEYVAFLGKCLTLVLCLVAAAGPSVSQEPPAKSKGDSQGDPLPEGALARLGTLRWRHAEAVTFVAFLPDGKAVLTGAKDNTLRLWDRESGKEIRRFTVPAGQQPGVINIGGNILRTPAGRGSLVVSLSPDGKMLAVAFPNNTIQLFDIASGKEIRNMPGPANGVGTLLFAPDSKMLAAAGGDRTVHLLDTETGKEIRQLKARQPKGDVAIRIVFGGGLIGGATMAFSPDGKTLATAEPDADQGQGKPNAHVKLTNVDTGDEIRRIDVPQAGASAIAYAPDGKTLAFVSENVIHLCDPATGKEIRELKTAGGAALLVFAPGSKLLATKSGDNVVRLWDIETCKEVHKLGEPAAAQGGNLAFLRFAGGGGDTGDLAITADGKTIAVGAGNTVRMWDTVSGKEKDLTGGHRGPVSAVTVSTDGKTLLTRGADGVIRRWDRGTGEQRGHFHEPPNTLCVAFSPDGQTAAFGGNDAVIRLYGVAAGKETKPLKGHANGTAGIVFAPDGKTLASHGFADNTIQVHDALTGNPLQKIALQSDNPDAQEGVVVFGNGPASRTLSLAFSPDGRTLIGLAVPGGPRAQGARSAASTVRIWDVATAKEVRKIVLPPGRGVGCIAVSPDGRILAMENPDQTISLIEIASGVERSHLGVPAIAVQPTGGAGMVFAVALAGGGSRQSAAATTLAFSPDGTVLACRKATANTVLVWDVDRGHALGQFSGHDGRVTTLAFTPDSKGLATGSSDTTVLLWNVAGLKRQPMPAGLEVQPTEAADLWNELAADDAGKAFQSILKLARASKQAVPVLRERVKPAVPADPKKVAKWIAELDSEDFEQRSGAAEALEKLGDLAVPALQKVLSGGQPTLETRRRVEQLLTRLTGGTLTPEQVRLVRAVEVLERTNTAEARQLLQTLADGAPGALTTRQAQAALGRKK